MLAWISDLWPQPKASAREQSVCSPDTLRSCAGLRAEISRICGTIDAAMLRATAVRRFAAVPIVPIIGAFLAKKAVASYAIFNAAHPSADKFLGRMPSTRRLLDGVLLVSHRATHRCTRTASRSSSDRSRTRRERGVWTPRREGSSYIS